VDPLTLGSEQRGETAPVSVLLENLPDAVFLIDERGAIEYVNPAASTLFGYPISEMIGRMFPAMLAEPFQEQYSAALREYAHGAKVGILGTTKEVVGRDQEGSGFSMELSVSEVRHGQARFLAAVVRDISERKRAESQLKRMADHDTLTGLLNRVSFEQAVTRHVEYAARYGSGGSVIALGIDNFQYVNQSLGAVSGDELVTTLAALLRARLRKTDLLGRVGGDIFGVLVHGTDKTKAIAVADELLGIVRRHAFVLTGEGIRVTMSAGVTELAARPITGAQLLAEAEAAMHSAKEAGRDRVAGFDPGGRGEADERRAWSERVRQATERGLFVLTSQPIVDLKSGDATQHEILLRMRGDGGGLVPPGEFLATAERFGLIGGIDRWVTQQSIRLIEAHKKEGRDLKLEVNLSGRTMGDVPFLNEVKRELKTSGIDPGNLIFEVTETAAVADIEQARHFAQSLSRLGCRFALDDFGAGYASFYYLKHLPISYLKIDGEFVRELPRSKTDQMIIKALVEACGGLGIKTVAEFVADEEILDQVRDLGVDYAQGYFLGKPTPVGNLKDA
jgi:diguanylate cyclase (GGDEF)-like protein/PAS domain S-box-containing protein